MSTHSNDYEPSPDFLARLDREVDDAFRREQRFIDRRRFSTGQRWAMGIGTAAGVALTLFTGIVVGVSAEYASAATPDAPRPALALFPVSRTLHVLGCTPAQPTAPAERRVSVAPQAVPTVDVSKSTAISTEPLRAILGVREAPDGRVLVNDAIARRVLLFERDLTKWQVVLDSIPGSATSYGPRGTPLLPFIGDSSLVPDPGVGQTTGAMRVLDAAGRIARTLALVVVSGPSGARGNTIYGPRQFGGQNPVANLTGSPNTAPDAKGRLVYRARPGGMSMRVPRGIPVRERAMPGGAAGRAGAGGGIPGVTVDINDRPDTIAIERMDLEARRIDTIAWVNQPPEGSSPDLVNGGGKMVVDYDRNGDPVGARQVINPLYYSDDWAVLSDGTVGIVRGRDYHVDWIHPDGSRSSSGKLAFAWRALSAGDKQRIIDSTRASIDSIDAIVTGGWKCSERWVDSIVIANGGGMAGANEYGRLRTAGQLPPAPSCPTLSGPQFFGAAENALRNAAERGADLGDKLPAITADRRFHYEIVPPAQMADYYPPIKAGTTRSDRDGNLWILPRTEALLTKGDRVYDIVNPTRGLITRVRIPGGRSIVGFGKGGVVYLQMGSLTSGFLIQRVTVPGLGTPKG